MPTISTALTFQRLLQHNSRETLAKKTSPPESGSLAVDPPAPEAAKRFYYSPALYTTPAPSRVDGFEEQPEGAELIGGDIITAEGNDEGLVGCYGNDVEFEEEVDVEIFDPRDSVSISTSGSDVEDGRSSRRGLLANQLSVHYRSQGEYYDTAEENELYFLSLSLVEESSRRNVAEKNLLFLNRQLEKVVKGLCLSGSSCPEMQSFKSQKNEIDPMELCQEIVVLKFVSEALETDLSRDEAEETCKKIIISKNHEISRLQDRMLYYEAMNHEMSQRNQEIVGANNNPKHILSF